ncbi:MAG TPA: HAMP domain-containing sensor histidine kinase [Alphaproteobacteria bacterium]|nr:HAMP domain-containing sensor histidine kinase [Alphaproteobacteria bacterium]
MRAIRRLLRRVFFSLTGKLIALVGIFVAVPIVLYGQFRIADEQMRELVTHSIQQRSWLVAEALRPVLDRPEGVPVGSLNATLQTFGDDGTDLQLMLQPLGRQGTGSFYYVASAPPIDPAKLGAQLDSLERNNILPQLSATCTADERQEIRYRQPSGQEEVLTSVIPIRSRWGCWVLISSHTTSEFLKTSIGRPYWQTHAVRIATFSYLVVALLAALIALSVWRNIRHFRTVAREIRHGRVGEYSFTARNVVPELSSVALDFDRLVLDLRRIAREIRQAAEDNAHSFKGPIATIQSALEPLRRQLPKDDERTSRALVLVDSSLERLRALIAAAQRLDNTTADLIEAPQRRVDLTLTLAEALLRYREVLAERNLRLTRHLEESVVVRAGTDVLDVIIENILDNAISFSPVGTNITVSLIKDHGIVDLHIEDEGPGIDPDKVGRIFDRYFSLRPRSGAGSAPREASSHSGLGLWIVRRNVEALGGKVTASNRIGGGLSVHVILPSQEE